MTWKERYADDYNPSFDDIEKYLSDLEEPNDDELRNPFTFQDDGDTIPTYTPEIIELTIDRNFIECMLEQLPTHQNKICIPVQIIGGKIDLTQLY